jgi:hypothetical protein
MHPAAPSSGHDVRPAGRSRACLGATASRLSQLFCSQQMKQLEGGFFRARLYQSRRRRTENRFHSSVSVSLAGNGLNKSVFGCSKNSSRTSRRMCRPIRPSSSVWIRSTTWSSSAIIGTMASAWYVFIGRLRVVTGDPDLPGRSCKSILPLSLVGDCLPASRAMAEFKEEAVLLTGTAWHRSDPCARSAVQGIRYGRIGWSRKTTKSGATVIKTVGKRSDCQKHDCDFYHLSHSSLAMYDLNGW